MSFKEITPAANGNNVVSLTQTLPGQRVRVSGINAGQELRAHLCAMGLTQGITVEVVAVGNGPVVLSVMGSKLVLGHGMASKIQVKATSVGRATK
jgi:Fe2+ transport system protein FeoA